MTKTVSLPGIYARLSKSCEEVGGQSAWANLHGVSPASVSDVLCARRDPGPKILAALGLRREVVFVMVDQA